MIKNTYLIIIISICMSGCSAQQGKLYTRLDNQAYFPSSPYDLENFIISNLNWPSNDFGGEGKVVVSFVVEKDGKLTHIEVEKSLCDFCDMEAIRLIKLMPKWIPGEYKGKIVRSQVSLPIEFKIKN